MTLKTGRCVSGSQKVPVIYSTVQLNEYSTLEAASVVTTVHMATY